MTLEQVKPFCDEYGFEVTDVFGEVHIHTKYEKWFFIPSENERAKTRLMHCNKLNDGWHEQFRREISPKNLILYIYEHETAKYGKPIDCHFNKNGTKRKHKRK